MTAWQIRLCELWIVLVLPPPSASLEMIAIRAILNSKYAFSVTHKVSVFTRLRNVQKRAQILDICGDRGAGLPVFVELVSAHVPSV
jgi:hypothetical protein